MDTDMSILVVVPFAGKRLAQWRRSLVFIDKDRYKEISILKSERASNWKGKLSI